jgi:hypothetical protein
MHMHLCTLVVTRCCCRSKMLAWGCCIAAHIQEFGCSHPGFPDHQEGDADACDCLLVLPAVRRHPGILICLCGAHLVLGLSADGFKVEDIVLHAAASMSRKPSQCSDQAALAPVDRQDRVACINRWHQPAAARHLKGVCSCCLQSRKPGSGSASLHLLIMYTWLTLNSHPQS